MNPEEECDGVEIHVRDDRKLVEIWQGGAEKDDPALNSLCARYAGRGYLVAVFRSGGEELTNLTAGLLLYNRRRLAEQSEQAEQQILPPA